MGGWQLPVQDDLLSGKGYYIHPKSKYHYFENNKSLCGGYYQDADFFETGTESGQILQFPHMACKKCFEKWKREFNIGC